MAEHDRFSCAPVLVINLRTVFHCDCIHLSSSLDMCEGARRARGLGFERQSRSWNAHKHYRSCATEDNGASREFCGRTVYVCAATSLSLIHISEPTRRTPISYAVFCLK